MDDKKIYAELQKTSSLNGWGAIGILLPIVGYIIYSVVISRINMLALILSDDQKKNLNKELHKRKSTAATMIVLIIVVNIFIYFWVISSLKQSSAMHRRPNITIARFH